MLCLSRKQNETIQIGSDIVIMVLSTGDGRVRLGITAPREVSVVRGELLDIPRDGRDGLQAGQAIDLTTDELVNGSTQNAI